MILYHISYYSDDDGLLFARSRNPFVENWAHLTRSQFEISFIKYFLIRSHMEHWTIQ
jgi:hypothetical protein